jgi:release factor glutamine methyltransferase
MQKEKISKIIDIINWGDAYFKVKDIPESRLNIELLLCAVLQCKRMNLYLNFDKPLIQNELDTLREYVKRRVTREPLQYILGETEFMGLPFKVNSNALIPRPETELLVEEVIKFAKRIPDKTLNILDIGSGSGNISISLAKLIPNSFITAIDCSEKALQLSKENAELNKVNEKIDFILSDILNDNFQNMKFDIIVSNPPYISLPEYDDLEPELKFEPKNALTDLNDGFCFYRRITTIGKEIIHPGGLTAVEIAYNQSEKVFSLFHDTGYSNIQIIKDYSNIDRIITGTLL